MSTFLSLTPNGGSEFVLIAPPHRPWVMVSQEWGNPTWSHQFSGSRGTQGARPSQGKLDNRTVRLAVKLYGTSADDVAARISELETVMGQMRRHGGIITRSVHGQTWRQYLRVLTTPGGSFPEWDKRSDLHHTVSPILEFVCAPLAEGDPMAWSQTFTAPEDVLALTMVQGTSPVVVEDGALRYTAANGSAPAILLDAVRGYSYGDVRMDQRSVGTGSASPMRNGVMLRYRDASNWLAVVAELEAGSLGFLRIIARVGGVESVLGQVTGLALSVVTSTGWVSGWIEGGRVFAEWRTTSEPSPFSDHVAPSSTLSAVLSSSQAAALGTSGYVGVVVPPINATPGAPKTLTTIRCQPFYYQGRALPFLGALPLGGGIPGDSPALGEVSITTPTANTVNATWAMLGWAQRKRGRNYVWNGHFEQNTDGWSAAAVSGVTAAATSISRTSGSTAWSGIGSMFIDASTTDASGATFRMFESFRAGRIYRAQARVRANGAAANWELVLGVSGDLSVRPAASNSGGFSTLWTVDWSPSVDVNSAYVGVRIDGTGGQEAVIDAVAVWDITDSLEDYQSNGLGGYSPLAVIPAIGHEQENGTTDTVATSMVGTVERATVSGAGSLALSYILDPQITEADDYTDDELEMEVWARVNISSATLGVRGAAWVNPVEAAYNADTLGARRSAHLWGVAGRPITKPSSGTAWRLVRLGIVPVRIERDNPAPVRFTVAFTWTGGSGNFDVDWVGVCPYRSRCLGPTGVSYSGGGYPDFIATNADEVTKSVRSDLSAVVSAPPSLTRYPDHGLGGSLLELPPGQVDLLVVLSDLVPDDPDAVTSSNAPTITAAIAVSPIPRWAHLREA